MQRSCILIAVGFLAACQAQVRSGDSNMQNKLVLSKQYIGLTHRLERAEDVYRRELKMAWNGCEDDQCRVKLDKAISKAVAEGTPEYENAYVRLMASRLTVDELQAAVSFAKSPEGKAIADTEIKMDDDIAQISHAFTKRVRDAVQEDFCPSELKACPRLAVQTSANPRSRP
jgi:hypothetical protein